MYTFSRIDFINELEKEYNIRFITECRGDSILHLNNTFNSPFGVEDWGLYRLTYCCTIAMFKDSSYEESVIIISDKEVNNCNFILNVFHEIGHHICDIRLAGYSKSHITNEINAWNYAIIQAKYRGYKVDNSHISKCLDLKSIYKSKGKYL